VILDGNLVPPRPNLVPTSSGTRLATPLATSSPRPLPYGGRGTGLQGSKAPRPTPTSSPILKASKPPPAAQPALPIDTPAPRQRAENTCGMPRWLRQQLTEAGVITAGYTRAARAAKCEKCVARVIKGWTDEPCAILATCDPAPLSNLGEVVAILQGRATYDLAYRGGRLELDDRDDFHIKGSPPETPNWWREQADVLAEHRCNTDPLPSIESRIP
jgi:hypothetical protein